MKKFFFDCGTREEGASLGLAALRVCLGLMFLIGHGIPKIQSYSVLKDFFYIPAFLDVKWGPPASLLICIIVEVGASLLLILGLATRPAAFLLGFAMVLAAFGAMSASPWFQPTATLVETKEIQILYLIPMLTLILTGAGAYSLDALLDKNARYGASRRRW
jgi:putative oxidoreductase